MQAVHLSEQKEWSRDLLKSHLKFGSGGKALSLEIFAYLMPSEGKQCLCFCFTAVVFEQDLICCAFHGII